MRKLLASVLLGWLLVLMGSAPVFADCIDDLDRTVDCSETPSGLSTDIPSGFIALIVLMVIGGIVVTIYKVGMARDMATRSGMDPNEATAMTLLDENGLSATYLASSLRPQNGGPTPSPGDTHAECNAAERLAELRGLLDQGLVTQAEYDERRAAILGSLEPQNSIRAIATLTTTKTTSDSRKPAPRTSAAIPEPAPMATEIQKPMPGPLSLVIPTPEAWHNPVRGRRRTRLPSPS